MNKANQFTIKKDGLEKHLDGLDVCVHKNAVTVNNQDLPHFKKGEQMSLVVLSDRGSFRGRYYVRELSPKGNNSTTVHFGAVRTGGRK